MDENLHVPVDEPVLLTMTSSDVIHSLFIPAMRVKMDVVPGRYSRAWFRATEAGDYPLYCTRVLRHAALQTCWPGSSCSRAADYKKWLAAAGDMSGKMSPAEYGELLYRRQGCANCHTTWTAAPGPGRASRAFTASRSNSKTVAPVMVEDNYIREIDPRTGGEDRQGISARDAHVQGHAQRQGHHGHDRIHQVAESRARCP